MTPEEALKAGAEYISEHGHTKDGRFAADDGSVCAMGGLAMACGAGKLVNHFPGMSVDWENPTFLEAGDLLARQVGAVPTHITSPEFQVRGALASFVPEWNDGVASAEEVILAMKRAGHGGT